MSLLFNSTGNLIVLDPASTQNYTTATITIPTLASDITANCVFLLDYQLSKNVIYSIQRSLRNDFYFYSTGVRYKPMPISGYIFNPDDQCGESSDESGLNMLISWFNKRCAYVSSTSCRTMSITLGDETLTVLLVGVDIAQVKPNIPLFKFNITVEPLGFS